MILSIDAAQKKDPSEWFGFWSMETGEWAFYDTKFSSAVKTPGSLILIKNFSSLSSYIAWQFLDLFEGSRRKVVVWPPHTFYTPSSMNQEAPWIYGCSEGVRFWLLNVRGTDASLMNKVQYHSLVEHME